MEFPIPRRIWKLFSSQMSEHCASAVSICREQEMNSYVFCTLHCTPMILVMSLHLMYSFHTRNCARLLIWFFSSVENFSKWKFLLQIFIQGILTRSKFILFLFPLTHLLSQTIIIRKPAEHAWQLWLTCPSLRWNLSA